MIITTKCMKLQTRTGKRLFKVKRQYGFRSLSETVDYLIGNDKVNKLLASEEYEEQMQKHQEGEQINNVTNSIETKDLH